MPTTLAFPRVTSTPSTTSTGSGHRPLEFRDESRKAPSHCQLQMPVGDAIDWGGGSLQEHSKWFSAPMLIPSGRCVFRMTACRPHTV